MKETIRAIHEAEVEDFFRSLGLLEFLENGKLSCDVCGKPLTRTSFLAVARRRGEFVFCCDRPTCAMTFAMKTKG